MAVVRGYEAPVGIDGSLIGLGTLLLRLFGPGRIGGLGASTVGRSGSVLAETRAASATPPNALGAGLLVANRRWPRLSPAQFTPNNVQSHIYSTRS